MNKLNFKKLLSDAIAKINEIAKNNQPEILHPNNQPEILHPNNSKKTYTPYPFNKTHEYCVLVHSIIHEMASNLSENTRILILDTSDEILSFDDSYILFDDIELDPLETVLLVTVFSNENIHDIAKIDLYKCNIRKYKEFEDMSWYWFGNEIIDSAGERQVYIYCIKKMKEIEGKQYIEKCYQLESSTPLDINEKLKESNFISDVKFEIQETDNQKMTVLGEFIAVEKAQSFIDI